MSQVLIVIPCLNEEAYLGNLVDKLVANTAHLQRKIVIAEGGSTDKTLAIARQLTETYPFVFYVNNTKRIQSAGVNLAVQTYGQDCDYIIRIDAHSDYPDQFCDMLIQEAQAQQADSVVVSMNTIGKSPFQKAVAAAQNSKLGNGGSAHRLSGGEGQWVDHGHHALMTRHAFATVGGYDESFSHNEDAELDYRLTQAGFRIWMTGKTDLVYYPRDTVSGLFRQYFKFGHGRAKTVFKHIMKPKPRQMAPLVVAPAAVLFVFGYLFCKLFMLPLLLWAFICLSYGALLAVKAKDKSLILSGLAIMTMHFAWSCGFWAFLWQHTMKKVLSA